MARPVLLPSYLETQRLVLRHWTVEDISSKVRAVAESLEHLSPWMPWAPAEPTKTDDQQRIGVETWQSEWASGGDSVLGMFRHGEVVGGTGLHRRGPENTLEIGYWLHVDHLGRGYATEAAAALTEAGFQIPSIEFVEIVHDQANVASRRIPEKLRYRLVEEAPREVVAPGEIGVAWRWRVSRSEWEGRPHPGLR